MPKNAGFYLRKAKFSVLFVLCRLSLVSERREGQGKFVGHRDRGDRRDLQLSCLATTLDLAPDLDNPDLSLSGSLDLNLDALDLDLAPRPPSTP
jgi:hypothetical protein